MNINELTPRQGNVEVQGVITELEEAKTFNKFGKTLTMVNAILEDSSGKVKLTLWNDDAVRFKSGDKVKIINGYVNEFQGEKQLTSGKFGKIEKLDDSQTELSE
jgi:ssDNA-binding replication factor A large subunit